MIIANPFGKKYCDINIPDNADIVKMKEHEALSDPSSEILKSFDNPVDGKSLAEIATEKIKNNSEASAVIVVSDNTRPIPYKGEGNILVPIIKTLSSCGYSFSHIKILVATGMHHVMDSTELEAMLDSYVFDNNIQVINHDAKKDEDLVDLGRTERGSKIMIDRNYVEADLKIVTGLIESHFMAGASGGRKAICPGLIGEESTFVFHGPELMAHPKATNLVIEGNPVHEESLAFAKVAGIDFLVNVTLNHDFKITGIFTGDFIKAHEAGVAFIREEVSIQAEESDIVITHGGYVGLNHYQCGKAAVASLGILKRNGYLIILGDCRDKDPVGSLNYKTCLSLLTTVGEAAYFKTICSKDWTFIPDQWQVQQWGKVFARTPMDHLVFYSPQLDKSDFEGIPGHVLSKNQDYNSALKEALDYIRKIENKETCDFKITYIDDGPYVVPFCK